MSTGDAHDEDDGPEDGPILVVDDDPHLRDALAQILEHEGHRVIQAPDGPTALAMTREHAPGLLVVDDAMPGMDGEAVLGELQRQVPDAPPALLMTAAERSLARVRERGVGVGLEKPFNVRELLVLVERHRRKVRRGAS